MLSISLKRARSLLAATLIYCTGLALVSSCQKEPGNFSKRRPTAISNEVRRLELRLQKIENRLQKDTNTPSKTNDLKTPPGPIKSLTFRIGTQDDRLRIYWADGTNSDLPCTKEQAIWVCG